jgi:hypothetical protein
MNKHLDEAINRLRELPEERQQAAAAMIFDFLEHGHDEILTPEQWAEVEAALAEDDSASDEEVETFFAQFRK